MCATGYLNNFTLDESENYFWVSRCVAGLDRYHCRGNDSHGSVRSILIDRVRSGPRPGADLQPDLK
jgi:hypothetical protein